MLAASTRDREFIDFESFFWEWSKEWPWFVGCYVHAVLAELFALIDRSVPATLAIHVADVLSSVDAVDKLGFDSNSDLDWERFFLVTDFACTAEDWWLDCVG